MENTSILLVEGTPSCHQDISSLLRRAGYNVKKITCTDSSALRNAIASSTLEDQNSQTDLTATPIQPHGTSTDAPKTLHISVANKEFRKRPTHQRLLTLDHLQLNRLSHKVSVRGQEMVLTSIQYSLLHALLENRGIVMQKSKLYRTVLNREFGPHDRSLDMHLSRLRRKLSDLGWQGERLKTVHGKGYCLS